MLANGGTPLIAAGSPANKAGAAATSEEIFAPGENQLLLSKQFKAGGPIDLVLQVAAECSIVTNVETVGNDDQEANGHIEVWMTLDGKPVVNGPGDHEVGHVVFCDRSYRRQTLNFQSEDGEEDEGDETMRTYFSTRSSHGFNWVALDIGSGLHSLKVWATLTAGTVCRPVGEGSTCTVNPNTTAAAVVGNRSLIIEPARFSHGADTISN
jgi:hypothetical protein